MRQVRLTERRGLRNAAGVLLFLLVFTSGYAQKHIRGIVIDSATFAPLANVNVRLKSSLYGTTTNNKGEFRITVFKKDTLVFSLVGHYDEEFAAAELDETTVIRMTEAVRILETVTVRPKGEQQKALPALHLAPSGRLMNYGASGAGINLAYFSRLEKEKRKLKAIKAEQERVKNYMAVVCSPDFRDRIMEEYSITDDEYYGLLARFNMESGDSLFNLSAEELVVVLNEYYKRNTRRK
jgi:hypothetical protein